MAAPDHSHSHHHAHGHPEVVRCRAQRVLRLSNPSQKTFTKAQVAEHTTPKSCWMVIHNKAR